MSFYGTNEMKVEAAENLMCMRGQLHRWTPKKIYYLKYLTGFMKN